MGDHHAEAIDFVAGRERLVRRIGSASPWAGWSGARTGTTQAERDRFEVPVLYPLLRNKYYIDDLADGIVAGDHGPDRPLRQLGQRPT